MESDVSCRSVRRAAGAVRREKALALGGPMGMGARKRLEQAPGPLGKWCGRAAIDEDDVWHDSSSVNG